MIDGLVSFIDSGFDARVYALCLAGFAAVSLIELRKATGLADFIRRLSYQLAILTLLAGTGLLILAMLRCADHQVPASITLVLALVISLAPFIYLRAYTTKLNGCLDAAKEEKPILRLPAPEEFSGKGEGRS